MLIDIFSFGEDVLGFVVPVFKLFKEEGFAPFLAFAMFAVSFLFAIYIYIRYIHQGKKSLQNALDVITKVSELAFTRIAVAHP